MRIHVPENVHKNNIVIECTAWPSDVLVLPASSTSLGSPYK